MLRARYRQIVGFFARALLGLAWWELVIAPLPLGRGWAARTRSRRLRRLAVGYRALAVRLGGVLIKGGQFLSARLDVLPEVITAELAGLQDEVPPERLADIQRLAEAELGAPLAERFSAFDAEPLAAASLGQVHRARLAGQPAGTAGVVVKIQRPNVEALIATDLAALRTVGRWLQRYPPIRRRADVPALLAEFTRILEGEIDYLAEGRNAETFAANFAGDPGVRVPRVVWSHTTRRVLTLEDVYAIKITDYDAITAAGLSRAEVADHLFAIYLRQFFDHGFFHADPHPGNLFVQPLPAAEPASPAAAPSVESGAAAAEAGAEPVPPPAPAWQLVFVDFGMAGHVPENLRAGLREMVIGFSTRDAARLVRAAQQMGMLLPGADLALIERAEVKMFDMLWGKDMSELRQISREEMTRMVVEFRALIVALPFQIPHDLLLLGRAGAILSGICTGLNPQFNAWQALEPFARRLVAEEVRGWRFWLGEAAEWARSFVALPRQLESTLQRLERGELPQSHPALELRVARLEGAVRLLAAAIVLAALVAVGLTAWIVWR